MFNNAVLGTGGLIGKNVWVEEKGYFDGTSIRLLVNPDKAATSANLIVKDVDGKEVAKKKTHAGFEEPHVSCSTTESFNCQIVWANAFNGGRLQGPRKTLCGRPLFFEKKGRGTN